jgi:hypothetical protein
VAHSAPDGYTRSSLYPAAMRQPLPTATRHTIHRRHTADHPARHHRAGDVGAPIGAGEERSRSSSRTQKRTPASLNYSSVGPGSVVHLMLELLKLENRVQYRPRALQRRRPGVDGGGFR